jgi:hypothetical protein
MAIDFYELGRKTGAKTAEGQQSNFEALTGGLTNTIDQMIKTSQLKTATLQAAMPQGIPIDKVPEELRAQATEFLTANKKAYTDASKVLASGISPQSQRYRDAVETINGVNTKFENLSTSLEGVALKRKAALDDPNGYSPSTSKEDRLTWGNLSNGDLYSSMTFNDDGTVNYTNSQGESKSFADFNVTPQSFEGQNTFLALNDKFTSAKHSGKSDQWSMHSGEAETTVNALFQKLKPAGQKDMMMGDIDYLEKTTGFNSGTDEYENAINGILENPNDAIAGYKQHILQTLENNYNAQKGPKGKDNTSASNPYGIPKDGLKLGAPMANGYRMKVRKDVVEGYINDIKSGRKFEFKNNKYTFVDGQWIENEGGMFRPGEEAPERIIGSTQELTDNVFENGGKYFDGLVTEVEIDPNTGKKKEAEIKQVDGTQSSFSPKINMSFMDQDDNDVAIGLQSMMPSAFSSNNPNGYKFKNLRSIVMDDFTAEAVGLYDDDNNIVRYPEGHSRAGEKVIIYTGGDKERRMKAIADLDDILNTRQFKIKGFSGGGQSSKADDLINKYSNI